MLLSDGSNSDTSSIEEAPKPSDDAKDGRIGTFDHASPYMQGGVLTKVKIQQKPTASPMGVNSSQKRYT